MKSITLRIEPALPCFTIHGERRCGKPAQVAQAHEQHHGTYLVMPICRECIHAAGKLYNILEVPDAESE